MTDLHTLTTGLAAVAVILGTPYLCARALRWRMAQGPRHQRGEPGWARWAVREHERGRSSE